MGLPTKKEEQLRRMPLIETRISKSKDGKYLIHKTIITTIRRTEYYAKVLETEGTIDESEVQKTLADDLMVTEGEDLLSA